MSARFAIHMESGVVVALTSETKGNYLYQEITPKVARAIADKKVSPQWVIDQIMAKMPRSQLRDKLKLEAQLNVRQVDFGLRDAARASADLGEGNAIDIELPGEGRKKGGKKSGKDDQPPSTETPPPPSTETPPPKDAPAGDAPRADAPANDNAPDGEGAGMEVNI